MFFGSGIQPTLTSDQRERQVKACRCRTALPLWPRPVPQGALEHREKIVADRIGHANMAYTLAIYTHRSTGKD